MSDDGGELPAALEILLVEDNPGDVRLTKEALRTTPIEPTVHVTVDGDEALEFLHQRGEYAEAPRPDLILLDLKLPRLNGDEVAAEIDSLSDLTQIPLIIMTGHPARDEVIETDELPIDATLRKPVNSDEFLEVVKSLDLF